MVTVSKLSLSLTSFHPIIVDVVGSLKHYALFLDDIPDGYDDEDIECVSLSDFISRFMDYEVVYLSSSILFFGGAMQSCLSLLILGGDHEA